MLASADLVSLIGVEDLVRARKYYGDVLGLLVVEDNPFAVVIDAHGTMLRLTAVPKTVPAPYSVLAWRVADIEVVADELAGRGVEFVHYGGVDQDDRGVWSAPEGTRIAWFLDPDGNNLSLVQFPS